MLATNRTKRVRMSQLYIYTTILSEEGVLMDIILKGVPCRDFLDTSVWFGWRKHRRSMGKSAVA